MGNLAVHLPQVKKILAHGGDLSIFIVAAAIILGLLTATIGFAYNSWKIQETKARMDSESFSCQPGQRVIIERWSSFGYQRYCQSNGQKDGSWQAWEYGHKVMDGTYKNGNLVVLKQQK